MKRNLCFLLGTLLLTACAEQTKKPVASESNTVLNAITKKYPENLEKVFDAHGGINQWNKAQTLVYEMVKPDHLEKHTTDLPSRKTRIDGKNFTIGFDGKDVWLAQKDSTAFRSNARFYHNLYFYFYAMPFVLGDDGITYEKTESLLYDGVLYPGIKVSYGENIGDSPEDNYFLYYDPESYQMEWLGYTVTYFNGEPSDKVSYIRYGDWQKVKGVLLPKTLTWYHTDDTGKVTEARNTVTFTNVALTDKEYSNDTYAQPENAVVVPRE